MQAILNIELDDKTGPADVEARHAKVMAAVRRFFTRAVGEVRSVDYNGPDGRVLEHTAVVVFEFHAQKTIVLKAAYQLALEFQQDCVAVLFQDGEGRLVGPEADRWGNFQLQYFKRPAMYELLQEAA